MKCDNCAFMELQYGIYGDPDRKDQDKLIPACNHPDKDIANVNNDVLLDGKPIEECCEHMTKGDLRDKHCQEESMLNKAEEMRQKGAN